MHTHHPAMISSAIAEVPGIRHIDDAIKVAVGTAGNVDALARPGFGIIDEKTFHQVAT
jgi:hypothetical protein